MILPLTMQDVSQAAIKMVELVRSLNQKCTANYVLDVWRGSMGQQVLVSHFISTFLHSVTNEAHRRAKCVHTHSALRGVW